MSAHIQFLHKSTRFKLRVVAVAIHHGYALLHRLPSDNYWSLPGGTGEVLEPAAETLRREMMEEIGEAVEVGRLLWVAENFFDLDGESFHEIDFFFSVRFSDGSRVLNLQEPFEGDENGSPIIFQWFPLDALGGLPLYPTFLRSGLLTLPAHTQHLVHRD